MFRHLLPVSLLVVVSALAQSPAPPADSRVKETMERAVTVVPAPLQMAWQRREVIAFTHFGVNTFDDREWGTGREDPKLFNPTALDCRQWIAALKSAGAKIAILTCKHHDGFCLWSSRYTNHSVKSSPWRGGRGDVVKEFSAACREAGMKVGIYLSPADLYQIHAKDGYYGDSSHAVPSVIPTDPASFKSNPMKPRSPSISAKPTFHFNLDNYNRYYMNQLYELLTEYGPISEIWLDGANPDPSIRQAYDFSAWARLIRALQPNALIHGQNTDIRWIGNERGIGRETEWCVLPFQQPADTFEPGDATALDLGSLDKLRGAKFLRWSPPEADVSIRPGWFYHDGQRPQSLKQLLDIYFQSVGRGAVLLLNVPPNRHGLFDEKDVRRLREFGDAVNAIFKTNLALDAKAVASNTRGGNPRFAASHTVDPSAAGFWMADDWVMNPTITYTLPMRESFNVIMLREEIGQSQRIEEFAVDARLDGAWKEIAKATTVGEKRLLRIPTVTTGEVRLRILKSRVCPTLRKFGLFFMDGQIDPASTVPTNRPASLRHP